MGLTRINSTSGAATLTIQPVGAMTATDYKVIMDTLRCRELIPMDPAAVFNTEGTNDQEPMAGQLVFEGGGLNTYGDAKSGPLIPAPQGAAFKFQYHTGCFLSCAGNISESWADRVVNQQSRIGFRGMSKGIYSKTWDQGS